MSKLRVSRKSKKWHRKYGWTLAFRTDGEAYWYREYRIKL